MPEGSEDIETTFEEFYTLRRRAVRRLGRSAGAATTRPSSRTGIPSGGLFTGAEVVKTEEQQAIWGGIAGEQFDQCYHLACDTIDNVDLHALEVNSDAVAYAVFTYAASTESVNGVVGAKIPGNFAVPAPAGPESPSPAARRGRPRPRPRPRRGASASELTAPVTTRPADLRLRGPRCPGVVRAESSRRVPRRARAASGADAGPSGARRPWMPALGQSVRSTTTGAWSLGPWPVVEPLGLRCSRSTLASTTRDANGSLPSTRSMRIPRFLGNASCW